GAGDRPQGRVRLHVRGDCGCGRDAGRDGEVPRPPRPEPAARTTREARGRVTNLSVPFGRETIESIIPHRPPFLLVDEIVELEPGRKVRGRLNVPADGWWFPVHFPERPVMPGVLTLEAIAQCGAVAVLAAEE